VHCLHSFRKSLIALAVLCGVAFAGSAGKAPPDPDLEYHFHSVVPLGTDAIILKPGKHTVYLLAAAESVGFEGMRRVKAGENVYTLLTPNGEPVTAYPQFIDFRVMATRRDLRETDLDPFPMEQPVPDLNQYLLGLQFELKVFHGLECRTLSPAIAQMVGMPGDVPYDERVYRLSFNIGQVPIGDKLVLEVLDPQGRRLTKFHLELN
jgi:hypothetical protein